MKIKVAYLVWNEAIVNNSIFNNQVINQIKQIQNSYKDVDVTLIIGFPLFPYLVKHRRDKKKRNEIFSFLMELRKQQVIKVKVFYNIFAFSFNSKFYFFPLHYLFGLFSFLFLQRKQRFDIIHCRSYHACFVGCITKSVYKYPKVIFDTRGRFPEEGVFRGSYTEASYSFRFWKKIEKYLLKTSDSIVNVAHTFSDILEQEYPFIKNKNFTIYTSTNTQVAASEKKMKAGNKLVFIGEISFNGGYNITDIVDFYLIYREIVFNPSLIIITKSDRQPIRKLIQENGIEREFEIFSTNSFDESYSILSACKFGFAFLDRGNEMLMKSLAPTVIAAKTGDYLFSGLPLIYDELIGGVNYLIRNYHLGMLVNKPFNKDEIQAKLSELLNNYNEVSNSCTQFALEFFSSEKNAERYFNIYTTLVKDTVIVNKPLPV